MSGIELKRKNSVTQLADINSPGSQIASGFSRTKTVPIASSDHCSTVIAERDTEYTAAAGTNDLGLSEIGKYQIRGVLGQGGMGVVYLAFDPLIEREVALKVLSRDVSDSPSALQRFLAEARSIGRLNHPNVVSIYEINETNSVYYLVMELLNGGNVAELPEKTGPIPWYEACRIAAEAARGLAAAHEAGLVHRDIKPANLMLTSDGTVKVVDFGLTKVLTDGSKAPTAITLAGQILGTPQFMSPEQFESSGVDYRTDIYALGATLFWLLSGRFPFHDSGSLVQLMKAHLMKPVPRVTSVNPELPSECDDIIAVAMAKNPEERFAFCGDFALELETLVRRKRTGQAEVTRRQFSRAPVVPIQASFDALVIEPSRLQSAITQDLLTQAGAGKVEVARSAAEAMSLLQSWQPEVIWTAMELPDVRGLAMLQTLAHRGSLKHTTVVVNSGDCTVGDLSRIEQVGCITLAPKSSRLDVAIRVLHAAGLITAAPGMVRRNIEPSSVPVRLISDSRSVPDALLSLLNEVQLRHLDVMSTVRSAIMVPPASSVATLTSTPVNAPRTASPLLTILIRSAATLPGDANMYSSMVSMRRSELAAAIQYSAEGLVLRAVGCSGVTALLRRNVDLKTIQQLVQASSQ